MTTTINRTRFTNRIQAKEFIGDIDASQIKNLSMGDISDLNVSGYEFTGAFTDRTTGQSGANDIGTDVEYTQAMATNKQWLRFGFNTAQQTANDVQYWGETSPDFDQTKGLFGGLYMPDNVNSMFNFVQDNDYNTASTTGNLQYNAATGSYNMSQLKPGDFCEFRFDFNLTPQIGNVTVETGLIWRTRDNFTFELTGQPTYLGVETAQKTFLFRPITTAYLASYEDVYASALPAIRCTGPVFCQPLTTLFNVQR